MASKTALRDARDRAGLTGRELAKRAGIAESTVSLLLRGYWGTAEDRARVRGVLGGDVRELFPHVPAAELNQAAYINAVTGETYPTSGPPLETVPRRVIA